MEFGKQGSSDTSSEESDQLEQVKDVKGTKRCYECTFCKRGFTNAQALGGHMNIHRKDRAKTKHQSEDQSKASRFVVPISSQPNRYYPLLEPHQDYYSSYLQPYASGSNTITNSTYWSQSMTTNPHLLDPNLSLRINSTHFEDSEVRSTEEVDLELKLGH